MKKNIVKKISAISWYPIVIGCIITYLFVCNWDISEFLITRRTTLEILMGVVYLFIFFFIVAWKKKTNYNTILQLILIGSFLFRAFYVLVAPYNIGFHDLGSFVNLDTMDFGGGHFGYIEYLYNYRKLPDFDPRQRWSFSNPPFFHILGAIIMGISYRLGVSAPLCYESIQIVNLFAASMTIYLSYKIIQSLVKEEMPVLVFTALIAFHPFFFLYSTELTNDMIATFFMALAIWYVLCWHKEHKITQILVIAMAIGLGMFTKLNSALICFGIAYIFLHDFWQKRDEWKKYFLQFAAFGVICVPLGLYFPLRNLKHFGMPINYIQKLASDNPQHIYKTFFARIGLPSVQQISYAFLNFDPELEYNIWLQLLRTSIFDEIRPSLENNFIGGLGLVLLWITILLAIVSLVTFIICLIKKEILSYDLKVFFIIEYAAMMISFVNFSFNEPFICTMNYRYIGISFLFPILGEALFLSYYHQGKDTVSKYPKRIREIVLYGLSLCFMILSFMMELYMIALAPTCL